MSADQVSASRVVPASPQEIFDLLADPKQHHVIDGSGMVQGVVSGPDRLSLGARFGMSMRKGLPYRITNKVVEFEEGRRIAWRHVGQHRWRYELEPVEGGTRVTETFDLSTVPALLRPAPRFLGRKNGEAIERTLDRLVQHFSS
jgi:uncharacterized protein YndB with AHSA1/START domain